MLLSAKNKPSAGVNCWSLATDQILLTTSLFLKTNFAEYDSLKTSFVFLRILVLGSARYPLVLLTFGETYLNCKHLQRDLFQNFF
jgi:hypothetical protein